MTKGRGRVALVGAGPGDPALLTVRAVELIRAADVVAHDDLISESILALVPESADLIAVGRRAGRGETPYRLHPEVLERAMRGQFVVRLKAGDPLVYGRGGEEAEELAAADIPYEIVPGITAALGAASYCSIPLTHRDLSAQVVIATGHKGSAPPPPSRQSHPGSTLVLYMASRDLGTTIANLVTAGWAATTPAALIFGATTAEERIVDGTLATLPGRAAAYAETTLPALIVVGEVVAKRDAIDWRRHLPLRGRRIVVARARSGGSRVAMDLRTLGADVLEAPHVEHEVTSTQMDLRAYEAVVVASQEAVDAIARTDRALVPPMFAIGADTAAELEVRGFSVAATVRGACSEGLLPIADQIVGRRVLVPVSERGRPALAEELARLGADPELVVVARRRSVAPARWPSRIDLVVLPASSAAQALYASAPPHVRRVRAVAMGARTETVAREHGVEVERAQTDSIEALVDAALAALQEEVPS